MKNRSDLLCQTWVYTQEESSREVMVYYAEGYPLPPARGREQMTFEPTGKFIKRVIAPACGLEEIPGTWQWQPNGNVVICISEGLSPWQSNNNKMPRTSSGLSGWPSNDKEVIQTSKELGDMEIVILSLTEQQLCIEATLVLLYR